MSRFDSIRLVGLLILFPCVGQSTAGFSQRTRSGPPTGATASGPWQTPARLHRGLGRVTAGTLTINPEGIAFAGRGTPALRWSFSEIQSLDISPHALVLTSYQNRRHHEPGDRQYHFQLQSGLSPRLAAEMARRLEKPARNEDPDPRATPFATIPAKHEKTFGGNNGELRFHVDGIDFVTDAAKDARAWRWADIQTIASPDPYHFRVGGYRETYEFELKHPMSSHLFDRLWDSVYARDLNLSGGAKEAEHDK